MTTPLQVSETLPPSAPQQDAGKSKYVEVNFSPWPMLLDYILRWAFFALYSFDIIPGWLFWTAQFIFIPLFIVVWVFGRYFRVNKLLGSDKTNTSYSPKSSFLTFLFYIALLGSGLYVFYQQLNDVWTWLRIVLVILDFAAYGVYLFCIFVFSIATPKKNKDKVPAVEAQETAIPVIKSECDQNDYEVLEAELQMTTMNLNVETFSLESTLFGGLAFSAFLTLIASSTPILTYTQELLILIGRFFQFLTVFDFSSMERMFASLVYPDHLFGLLSLECLFTSLFFILVIASKVRYHALQRHAYLLVKQVSKYNQKENAAQSQETQPTDPDGQTNHNPLTAIVSKNLEIVNKSFKELQAIINYMNVFRNLGLGAFFTLLITGAFIISNFMGIIVSGFIVLAFFFTSIDKLLREKRLNELVSKIFPNKTKGRKKKAQKA